MDYRRWKAVAEAVRWPVSFSEALALAYQATGATPEDFARNCFGNFYRGRRVIYRWAVWAWLREFAQLDYAEIARMTGFRNHSVVLGGIKSFWKRAERPALVEVSVVCFIVA